MFYVKFSRTLKFAPVLLLCVRTCGDAYDTVYGVAYGSARAIVRRCELKRCDDKVYDGKSILTFSRIGESGQHNLQCVMICGDAYDRVSGAAFDEMKML